jgi:hypothetical protein
MNSPAISLDEWLARLSPNQRRNARRRWLRQRGPGTFAPVALTHNETATEGFTFDGEPSFTDPEDLAP